MRRYWRLAACLLAVALPFASSLAAPAPKYRGRLLVDALGELRNQGLELMFSTDLVTADLRVMVEPTSQRPRDILDEILNRLDLHGEDGPGGKILIRPGAKNSARVLGRVTSVGLGRPIPGATIREATSQAVALTDANGHFELKDVPTGACEVSVEAPGFLPAAALTRAGKNPDSTLLLVLEPQPRMVTNIVVTPGRHSVLSEHPATSHVVAGDDVVLAPAIGGDISRVVELLPGVAAQDNSAAFHARGSVTQDVSVVLDGLELYAPFHLESFQSPFSLVAKNVVDRIDFLGGGFTADLGDRHGGFVEIATAPPGPEATGDIELGTLNSGAAYRASTANPAGSWLLSLRAWYPEALLDSIELGGGERMQPRFGDLYAKAVFALSGRTLLSAHGLFATDRLEFGETGEGVNESVDARSTTGNAWLRLLTTRPGGLTAEAMFSGGRIEQGRAGVAATDAGAINVDDSREVAFWGLKGDLDWQFAPDHAFRAGADVRGLRANYRYTNEPEDDPASATLIRLAPSGASLAAYGAYRTALSETLTTEFGLRWDRQSYTDDNQLSPRVNAVWRPGERSELRLAVGRFHQSQRIHELHVEDGETQFGRAEIADQAELSLQFGLPRDLRLRIDAYYRRLSELRPRYENLFEPIELFPETSEDRIEISPTEARLRGIELMLRGSADRPFHWWASYALSSADDLIDGTHVARSWDQTQAGKFLLGYRRGDLWSASLSGTVHTGWPTTPVSARLVTQPDGSTMIEAVPGERNSTRFSSYARVDFKALRSFALPRGRLSFTLDVVNLTDRDNACCVDGFLYQQEPDGTVLVREDLSYWLGITPSFSVTWDF